jgi:hypothetical protein
MVVGKPLKNDESAGSLDERRDGRGIFLSHDEVRAASKSRDRLRVLRERVSAGVV